MLSISLLLKNPLLRYPELFMHKPHYAVVWVDNKDHLSVQKKIKK